MTSRQGCVGCSWCRSTESNLGAPLLGCSRCKATRYCSKQCQKNHSKSHKPLYRPHTINGNIRSGPLTFQGLPQEIRDEIWYLAVNATDPEYYGYIFIKPVEGGYGFYAHGSDAVDALGTPDANFAFNITRTPFFKPHPECQHKTLQVNLDKDILVFPGSFTLEDLRELVTNMGIQMASKVRHIRKWQHIHSKNFWNISNDKKHI